jgi:hypothetical protein
VTVAIERDQYSRPLLPDPTTRKRRPWTRATTLAGTISERRALEAWSRRNVVKGFVANEDLLLRAAAAGDDRKQLDEIVKAADEAARASAAADKGTALHALTEKIDRGEDVTIPRDYQADIDAYTTALRENGIKVLPEFIETMTINTDLEAAGTPDRIVTAPGSDLPVIFDLKTGHNALKYSLLEISAQLTVYAWASHYYDGQIHPMPEIDKTVAIVAWLPVGEGRCELHDIDLNIGKQVAQLCHQVRAIRKTSGIATPRTPGAHSDDEARRRITRIKEELGDKPLPVAWPSDLIPPSRLDRPYTKEEASAVCLWCAFVEDELGVIPF